MFEKLRGAFSSLAKAVSEKRLSEKDLDEALYEFQMALMESDVAQNVVEAVTDDLKKQLLGISLERSKDVQAFVKEKLREEVLKVFSQPGEVDVIERVKASKAKGEPLKVLFLGINGTGKTTTVAKFANFMKKSGFSVVIAAGDTHRAGAIEQVSEHAERISVKVVAQRYGADPAAVARDGVLYAKAHHVDVVLIDSAGRMQTNQNLMEEMAKIVRVVSPDLKIFIGDSLAGNDAVSQAELFSKYTGFDGAILTKVDADAKGGAALSIAFTTKRPILFLGVGQGYDDLKTFDASSFADSLVG
ncbi:MAG: signal recognition particle-docking protein FtsY [Nitrososphaerota archaeon]|nr:signal recognition particle-docking protein FtsY [Nitrososphaerota archaeon]MDG6962496.1 signal recognition particle-docking protein FtsY [Nitrososphaerota archaeon]MDG6966187.1 signal recognition particle-docking protein FtsY [Nitrososphaerota archaeon]MDG6977622.1 signal recognition particle-docking protein FtsY [Nitrososphaerota archaeon]MDG7006435.1 signal recognition particle-docking protein FtsY [Nitrososphaerota archaeon]